MAARNHQKRGAEKTVRAIMRIVPPYDPAGKRKS